MTLTKYMKYLLIGIGIITFLIIFIPNKTYIENNKDLKDSLKLEKKRNFKLLEVNTNLRALLDSLDASYNIRLDSIERIDSIKHIEYKETIKKLRTLNSSELQTEMIEEYEKFISDTSNVNNN